MDPQRWNRVKELFESSIRQEPSERSALLVEACDGDADLMERVQGLLAAHEETDTFLELPDGASSLADNVGRELIGTRIGHFLVEDVISAGGMGTVYRARQENPARTVAVKVMREGLASPAAVRRFEYEAHVLAHLTHPNIAQVIEAGTHRPHGAGQGLPYFVMEYVPEAKPITEYAWGNRLSMRQRLHLFRQACEAVAHGHQKGVIHRDLKPANILVDASGQVKVIDFGVARATDADLRRTTALTDVGQLVGTVQYMSPEQCEADSENLDTRSDVYSLGVVLYELLCEALPYEVHQGAILEAVRIVQETPPRRPSTIHRRLRGDIETIVLKALEKERLRRYQAVGLFVADIDRHLRGDEIHARPVGPVTRFGRRIQRNPAARAASIVAFLSIIGFSAYVNFVSLPRIRQQSEIAATKQQEAEDARVEAVQSAKEAEEAKATAERNERVSRVVGEFLKRTLSAPRTYQQGHKARVIDLLDEAAEGLAETYAEAPEVELELRATLAWTYDNLGQYGDTVEQWRQSLAACLRAYEEDSWQAHKIRGRLADALLNLPEYEEAERLLREAIPVLERSLGPDHQDTLFSKGALGECLSRQNELEEAEPLLRETLAAQRRVLGPHHRNTLYTADSLGGAWVRQGRFAEAEELGREVIELAREALGPRDPETIGYMRAQVRRLHHLNRDREAEALAHEVLEYYEEQLSDEHPHTIDIMDALAIALSEQGKMAEAEEILRRCAQATERIRGPDHPQTLSYLNNLGVVLGHQDKSAEAREICERVLESRLRVQGPEHSYTIGAMTNYANRLLADYEFEEAEAVFREALDLRRRVSGPTHPHTLSAMTGLANVLFELDQLGEAEELVREALEMNTRKYGEDNIETLQDRELLARVLIKAGELEEAEVLLVDGLELVLESLSPDHPLRAEFHLALGDCETRLELFEVAEEHLLACYELTLRIRGSAHRRTHNAIKGLIRLYRDWERAEKEAEWRALLEG